MKGSVGLSSALSKAVLLRIRVATGADVHYTTTISAFVPSPSAQEIAYDRPSDMYIADLTDVVVKKKHLPGFSNDWVLCLGDLSLALPLDRTVASLESTTDLALVKRQFAVEHGLRIGDRRGGDPSSKSSMLTFDLQKLIVSINIQEGIRTNGGSALWIQPIRLQSTIYAMGRAA